MLLADFTHRDTSLSQVPPSYDEDTAVAYLAPGIYPETASLARTTGLHITTTTGTSINWPLRDDSEAVEPATQSGCCGPAPPEAMSLPDLPASFSGTEGQSTEHDTEDGLPRFITETNYRSQEEYQSLAKLCARFIGTHFNCRSVSMQVRVPSATAERMRQEQSPEGDSGLGRAVKPLTKALYVQRYATRLINYQFLELFILRLMYRTQLHECVTFSALMLIHRLRCQYPLDRPLGVYGHKLFVAAYVVASKILCESGYKNGLLARGVSQIIPRELRLTPEELFIGEANFCSRLHYSITINPELLAAFTHQVKSDYSGEGPYPHYDSQISASLPSGGGVLDMAKEAPSADEDSDSDVEI